MKAQEKPTVFSAREKLPPVGVRVMVATDTFRCLGYRDGDRVWRHDKDGRQIENVIGWYPFLDRAKTTTSVNKSIT